jgi:hypothetical protein
MLAATPSPISMRHFTWMPKSRSLVAEASSLPGRGRFHRLYADACDVGIAVRSHYTGRVVIYAVHSVERRKDSIPMWWDLRPLNGTLTDVTVRIFND